MTPNSQKIRFFRRQIPAFDCEPGCHDCCGPITASSEEMARLPRPSDENRAAALTAWNCPNLGENGCRVYAERPLICRLFGTTPKLPCPRGKGPQAAIEPRIEQQIYRYFAENRHVLI